jgi:DNA-binding NtrC family response regulator
MCIYYTITYKIFTFENLLDKGSFMTDGNILVVDDNEEILLALVMYLREHFAKVHARKSPKEALACLQREEIDVFILDMNYTPDANTGREGIELLHAIRRDNPHAVVVFITEFGDEKQAIAAIKAGANNYIQKPWGDQRLLVTVKSALELSKSRQLVENLREQQRKLLIARNKDHQMIYGGCRAMDEVMRKADKAAGTNAHVIIMGESGTGKELLAREIHGRSARSAEVFMKVDLGSMSESSIESDLFGAMRGATADAHLEKPGCFQMASGGTLFFNDIIMLPQILHVKVFNALKNKESIPVGSNTPLTIDTRIISSIKRYPAKREIGKKFHEGLWESLNTIRINLPPLRDRMEDLPLLIDFFLKRLEEKYKRKIEISGDALKRLEKHHWPGNVRELKERLEKAVILAEHNTLSARDFLFKSRLIPAEGMTMVDLKQNEKEIIKRAILLSGGNLSRAARHLGISRRTLYNKISHYEI